jgi:hypothetical protein
MSVRQFLDVVPKSVKTVAAVIACGGGVIGLAGTFIEGGGQNAPFHVLLPGVGLGLLGGVMIAIWALCVGYVNADARRRGMPPILWTLIVVFIPNLLGFLLYCVALSALRAGDYGGATILLLVWLSRIVSALQPGFLTLRLFESANFLRCRQHSRADVVTPAKEAGAKAQLIEVRLFPRR